MKACARIHTEISAWFYDVVDIPTPNTAREYAHQLRLFAKKYDQQAEDEEAGLNEGSNDDDNQN